MKGPVTSVLQSAAVATGNGVEVAIAGYASVGLQVTIATTATVTFEGSADKGTTWVSVLATKIGTTTTGATATATGAYQANVAGLTHFRARISAWTSGAVTVTATFIEPGGSSGGGAGVGGSTTQYAEDAAHTSGDSGVLCVGIRSDTLGTAGNIAGTAGDYMGLQTDAVGALYGRETWKTPLGDTMVDDTNDALRVNVVAQTGGSTTDTDDGTVAAAQATIPLTIPLSYEYDGTNHTRVRGPHTVAHDAADAGNPEKLGAVAKTAISGVTLVAADDRTNLHAGVDGVLITRPHCNLEDIVSGVDTDTAGDSTSVIAAQGAGIKVYVTSVVVKNTHATTDAYVDIRDGAAGTVKATLPAPAAGGGTYVFPVPIPFTANTAICVDPSAAVTTIITTVVGFKSKV